MGLSSYSYSFQNLVIRKVSKIMTKKEFLCTVIVVAITIMVVCWPRPPKEPVYVSSNPGVIERVGNGFIDVSGYGRFMVTPDQAEHLRVGQKAPAEILRRGS